MYVAAHTAYRLHEIKYYLTFDIEWDEIDRITL
jgi:hypothetical protein